MSTTLPRTADDELALAQLFVHAVRDGSLAAASRRLGLSPSRASRRLTELETLLGARLLVRTTRRHSLTEAGHVYLVHAERLLDVRQEAHDAVAELRGDVPRGRLRVTMPVAVGTRLLASQLPAFRAAYPGLRVEVHLSDEVVDLVAGAFDLAVRLGPPGDDGRRARRLGVVDFGVTASPAYLSARGAPGHPDELTSHEVVGLGPLGTRHRWPFWREGGRPGSIERVTVDLTPGLHTTSPALAARLAVGGAGLLRAPRWVVRQELDDGALVPVLGDWRCEDPRRGGAPLWLVYAQGPNEPIPRKSRVFAELVEALTRQEQVPA